MEVIAHETPSITLGLGCLQTLGQASYEFRTVGWRPEYFSPLDPADDDVIYPTGQVDPSLSRHISLDR